MSLIYLGNGWHDLESSETGNFIWSSEEFYLYVDDSVLEIELYINCNKTQDSYNLKYSLDEWESFTEHSLEHGINSVNILLNRGNRIDFKSQYFIPSLKTDSSDNRKLGIQLIKILYKTKDGVCYDTNVNTIQKNVEVHNKNKNKKIDIDKYNITLGEGWHELENFKFRWSNGNGVIYIKDYKFKNLKLHLFSPVKQKLIVEFDNHSIEEIDLEKGEQNVYIKNKENIKFIKLITNKYLPSVEESSNDNRSLGICVYDIDVSNLDGKINTYFINNIFLEKDCVKLIDFLNTDNRKISDIDLDGHVTLGEYTDNIDGKLNLNNQIAFYTHRSGWYYALESIKTLHSNTGVKFEGFLEKPFHWDKYSNIKNNILPFKENWVGVIHNPMIDDYNSLDFFSSNKLLNSIVFQKSLEYCKGLYVLSNDLKQKLENKLKNIKIEFLYHPTQQSEITFTLDNFYKNNDKKILNIGSWARKFLTIYQIKVPKNIKKIMIQPTSINLEKFQSLFNIEKNNIKSEIDYKSVETIEYQSSNSYDKLLSENIIFMDFYDISASNLIVECIIRNTPILIKKHNAVVDYLGNEYPFYFDSVEEASEKINDQNLIEKTYNYLLTLKTKTFLSGEYFCNSIKNGEIYKSL